MLEKRFGFRVSETDIQNSRRVSECYDYVKKALIEFSTVYRPGFFEWANDRKEGESIRVAEDMLNDAMMTGDLSSTKMVVGFYYKTYMNGLLKYVDENIDKL
jgi:hypothetical protein